VAFHRGAPPPGEQPEPFIQQAGDLGRGQGRRPGRGQFDGQRHAVQAAADLDHRGRVGLRQSEAGAGPGGPLAEQAARPRRPRRQQIAGGVGQLEGPQRPHLLARNGQRLCWRTTPCVRHG
jgi:hypothetical protein